MAFPSSPSNNQTAIVNGITHAYDSSKNAWVRQQTSISASGSDDLARTIANTATNNITIIQGVNTSQNTRLSVIEGGLISANANTIFLNSLITTNNTRIDSANNTARAAYDKANAAFDKANTGGSGGSTSTSSNTAPVSPAVGDIWYKISNDTIYRYTNDGTSNYWVDTSSSTVSTTGSGTAYSRTSFTATAAQTTFSVTYTVNYIQVYVNGVLLNAADYTATSGTNIVLAVACTAGDIVETVAFTINSVTTTTSTASNSYADANTVIFINNNVISANANIAANKGAMSVGPVYYAAGVTVNMAANSRWVIL